MDIKQKISFPPENLEDFIAEILLKELPYAVSEAIKFSKLHGEQKKQVVKNHVLSLIEKAGGRAEVYEKLIEGAIEVCLQSKAFKNFRKNFYRAVSKCSCRKVEE